MSAIDLQDYAFIQKVREQATKLLDAADELHRLRRQWEVQYSGRLSGVTAAGSANEGITKDMISAALDISSIQLLEWIDEKASNRRGYLEAIRLP